MSLANVNLRLRVRDRFTPSLARHMRRAQRRRSSMTYYGQPAAVKRNKRPGWRRGH